MGPRAFRVAGDGHRVVAALVLRMCRHQSASVRYLVACGALAAMLVSVMITATLVKAPDAEPQATRRPMRTTVDGPVDVLLPIAIDEAHLARRIDCARVERFCRGSSRSGSQVCCCCSRASSPGGGVFVVCISARCRRCARAGSMRRIASRAGLGLARAIRIVELPGVDVPLVVGCLRPIVVLPIAAMAQLTAAQVEAILAHELAHVRRHDYLVNLMQTLAETLLFYHPAVWWLSARIRDEREHCCDDVAVAVCGDAAGYAAALTELESWRTGELSLAAAATGGSLLNRVRQNSPRRDFGRLAHVLLTFGLVALAVAARWV